MADNRYHIVTHWRVAGSPQEVMSILEDVTDLPRWWPAVYLDVQVVQPGDANGIGQVVELYTRGFLPYTLRWRFRSVEKVPPQRMQIEAMGDFVGAGVWTFEPEGPFTNITYDWDIQAEKPLLRRLTFLLRPIFTTNHLWAMRKGEQSLRLELARRHLKNDAARALLPPPPQPVTTSPVLVVLLTLGVIGAVAWLLRPRSAE